MVEMTFWDDGLRGLQTFGYGEKPNQNQRILVSASDMVLNVSDQET